MTKTEDVVDEKLLWKILEKTKNPPPERIREILVKAREKEGLSLEETAALLNTDNPDLLQEMFHVSGRIKDEIYGERLVLFAPLYLSSYCTNDCAYCGFHRRNPAPRKRLSCEEIREETKVLIEMGHKRLLLECGEHPRFSPIDYVVEAIETIYAVKSGKGEIRRLNVNIAAASVEDYKKLKKAGIGTYQLFQETYHRQTYEKLHRGPKADYERQLFAHDRAMQAGIDDVGIGVLFGLFDYRFDALALVSHAEYLERTFNVGPHTLSVPRFQRAETVESAFSCVSEEALLQIISILRMAVPYTGMILSTRESAEIREKAFKIGISQTSAASRTAPGAYGKGEVAEQFSTQDKRSVDAVIHSILKLKLIPSFCTACYRLGRTGEAIMQLIKAGKIHELCRPNALLTLKEYLEDYASLENRKLGEEIVERFLSQIPENLKRETAVRLERIENGERDLYF
ncbi:MAG: [FeFe] hydrogenase H-cluster radical SAM maturase HydG [Chlamydiae bacterium RIFCSPHIGHO2_02_FULL_49_29]|nr:MAG: [FeFe] hydrogenase H-cluster radical SAM maturase HydG [Chlamydiae bacterium RIFCSPHIGHO2_02_FULL_49_29]